MSYKAVVLSIFLGLFLNQSVIAKTEPVVVLDVRTPKEFNENHLKDSVNIDILSDDFKSKVEKLDKNKTYKVYCRSGNRSGKAEKIMKSMGFKDVESVGSLSEAAKKLNQVCKLKNCL